MLDGFFHYLPGDPASAAYGLTVSACGWTIVPAGNDYPPPGHPRGHAFAWERGRVLDEWQVVAISRGTGVLESASGGRQALGAGDAFVLAPGDWHRYRPDRASGWDEHWLALVGDLPRRWSEQGLLCHGVLAGLATSAVLARLRAITDIVARHPPGFGLTIAGLAAALVADLGAAAVAADDTAVGVALRATCARLAARPDRPLAVSALARQLGISERGLRRAFIAQTGLAPKVWHDGIRLEHARRLLAGGLGVVETAMACGYASRSAFSRRYRRRFGVPPAVHGR